MSMKVLGDVKYLVEMRRREGRPRSGPTSFLWRIEKKTVVIVACAGWKGGKPVFGFPPFQGAHAGAVEM